LWSALRRKIIDKHKNVYKMAKLQNFIPDDDTLNVGGYEDLIYFAPASEFVGNPKAKDKLSTPVTTQGSSKDVGEAYAFVATVGKGYWRKLLCISGSVESEFSDAGESGTLSSENVLKGKIRGNSNAGMELYDLIGSSAGIVFLARDKSDGLLREFGTPISPAVKSSPGVWRVATGLSIIFEMIGCFHFTPVGRSLPVLPVSTEKNESSGTCVRNAGKILSARIGWM
jgi:hypothetical protein